MNTFFCSPRHRNMRLKIKNKGPTQTIFIFYLENEGFLQSIYSFELFSLENNLTFQQLTRYSLCFPLNPLFSLVPGRQKTMSCYSMFHCKQLPAVTIRLVKAETKPNDECGIQKHRAIRSCFVSSVSIMKYVFEQFVTFLIL